ncbi:MAG: methionyl-tRNA formyltransferase [Bifidobacteriaceae bacterium]|jgi:methionyl-tRNA formyltransferase|nr:methionyl-tRNA formyltransferase [Bifidobacteriaceae bacterium]
MRIMFAGTPEVAIPSLVTLAASDHKLMGVITRPDRPAGRGRRVVASPVALKGEELGLPVLKPAHPKDPEFLEQLRQLAPDVVAVVAYGALLPQTALDIPPQGWINLHFSLLPAWRGAAPVQHAIWQGDAISGATTFRIVRELDAGPIYGVMTYELPPRATSGEVLEYLGRHGAVLLKQTLDLIASGQARPQNQPPDAVSYASKITSADAEITWDVPAWAVDRQVRACFPDPGAWTWFRGQRIKLGPVMPLVVDATPGLLDTSGNPGAGGPVALRPGELWVEKKRVLVGAAPGVLVLGQVAPAGHTHMEAAAWARGARIEAGERLGI